MMVVRLCGIGPGRSATTRPAFLCAGEPCVCQGPWHRWRASLWWQCHVYPTWPTRGGPGRCATTRPFLYALVAASVDGSYMVATLTMRLL